MALDPAVAAARRGVRAVLRRLEPGATVLVACSGGADSLALLAATVHEARAGAHRVIGAIVDHGLQDGSAVHTSQVVAQMVGLGVDETASVRVSVDAGPGGIEAGAREARYAALGELATHVGADLVLLGHTLDDQAETVLLGLARGSGGRSLSGMRPTFEVFARPLLSVTRAETEAACAAEGISWWTDPHNADPRFLRSRVRHTVLPLLEDQLGPGVAAALSRTGEMLREDLDALDDLAVAFLAGHSGDVPVADLAGLPTAVRTRVVRRLALGAGAPASELGREHVLAAASLSWPADQGKQVRLPGHLTAYVEDGALRFTATRP